MDISIPIKNDPESYCEEWFQLAILTSKEFQLPNLTSPILANFSTENSNISETQIPPPIQANPLYQNVSNVTEVSLFDLNFEPQSEINNLFLGDPIEKIPHEGGEKRKSLSDQNDSFYSGDARENFKCFICALTFANGNALGGHMSAHAKKRKMETIKAGIFNMGNAAGQSGPMENAGAVRIEDGEASSQEKEEKMEDVKEV